MSYFLYYILVLIASFILKVTLYYFLEYKVTLSILNFLWNKLF